MSDRRDIEGLAATLGDSLVRLAFVLTGDGDEAQDVVQTVFVKLMSIDLAAIENPAGYARRAVANEVMTRGRRRALFRRVAPKLWASDQPVDPADSRVVDRQMLLTGLAGLNTRQRTALTLRYLEDYDDQVIAEILDCSPATVRSIAARALTKMRVAIDGAREE